MTTATIAVQVPQPLYHRLQRMAELTWQPLESLVVQALSSSIPLLPDDLAPAMRETLVALEHLSDYELQQVADARLPEEQYERYTALRAKRRAGTITQIEQAALDQLSQEADLLTLRKAYAAVLLKWREHQLPASHIRRLRRERAGQLVAENRDALELLAQDDGVVQELNTPEVL